MKIRTVSRLTGPQLAEGLDKLGSRPLKELRTTLATAPPGREEFIDGVVARLAKEGQTARGASATALKRAVSLELAKLERAVSTSGVRKVGETVSLATVEKNFGQVMRRLLEALEAIDHIAGRLDHGGRVPLTRALVDEVNAVYTLLGGKADDALVVAQMAKIYSSFDDTTLDELHEKFATLLPSRRDLHRSRLRGALRSEAELVAKIVTRQNISTVPKLIQVMQALGHDGFDVGRLGYLRRKHPDIVPSLSRVHTPEEFAAVGENIRAFIDKHPAATARVVARALSLPGAFVVEAAELAGLALSLERTARILDPYDPVCDGLVRHALSTRALGAGIEPAAATLNANATFVERYGQVSEAKLRAYVEEYLPSMKTAGHAPAFTAAKPGVRDRAYAELTAFFYATPGIDEPGAFTMMRAFDPSFSKYALVKMRKQHPDLSLGLRIVDVKVREEMARHIGGLLRDMPDATHSEIAELAWQQGLPRLDAARISNLRAEFPELIDKRIERANDEGLRRISEGVAAHLAENPHASIAEVARAVGARETQVVKPMRRVRDERMDTGQTRFTGVDHALIERTVRAARPGDTLGDIRARLLEDTTFTARHRDVSIDTVRLTIIDLVPEAADWKAYNLTLVARVLNDALEKAPEGKALSRIVAAIKQEYPGFPSYVTLCGTTSRSLEKHIDKMPFLDKYLVDGRLKFSTRGPEARLTAELARIVGRAFAAAPPSWSNAEIFAHLHEDAQVRAKYPVLNESTLTSLRRIFPGAIPQRVAARVEVHTQLEDAHKLAKQLEGIVARGEKIKLDSIAKEWGVDPQYFRRILQRHPQLFPMYRKRYEITEHVARTMGSVIATMPMGTSIEQAAVLLEKSGLFPPDMKLAKTLLINAQAKFPALVPNLKTRNEQLFLRLVCRELATSPKGTPLAAIFDAAKARTGQLPVSLERFRSDFAPQWANKAGAQEWPSWVKAVLVDGKVASTGLGRARSTFPKQDQLAIERDLAQLAQVPDRLEMLERIVARKARNAFAEFNVLNIQHLLGSNFRFVEAVHRLGAKKEDIVTVGIPYSTSETVARSMNEGGLETYTPPLNIAAWERQVEDALYALVEKSKANGKQVVVFDDGGLVAKLLHEKPWFAEHKKLFRIVEQTTRGITVAKKYQLEVPLVNYAQDPAKNLEGSMIGEVVLDRIYKRLDVLGRKRALRGMPVTCVGAGVIGLPTALDLARAGARVRIYDLDPAARAAAVKAAKQEGLDIEVVGEATEAFKGAQMIVGSTGHTSIGKEAFDDMADGCMLVSTSSKLVEIDMGMLDAKATGEGVLRRKVVDHENHPPTCEYLLDDGRRIVVLADGFPVNFDGAVNCVEPEDIQLTHAGMLLAGIQATRKNLDNGLLGFDDKLRDELLADWAEVKANKAQRDT